MTIEEFRMAFNSFRVLADERRRKEAADPEARKFQEDPKLSIDAIRAKYDHHFLASIISQSAHLREYHQSEAARYAGMLAEERKFRDQQMEADRQKFMSPSKEAAMPEPVPEQAPMPQAPNVGEPLVCRHCPGWTEGEEPRWSDEAVSPQGVWRKVGTKWRHHCRAGVWREAVNPFAAEGL